MAKINVRGATALLRADMGKGTTAYILCSDGRVLRRWSPALGGGLSIHSKFKDLKNMEANFRAWATRQGMTVREGK